MRSDAEDSRQQQSIQQRYYDEAWSDWNTAEVGHVYTVDIFLFAFSLSFFATDLLFFVIYFARKSIFSRNLEDISWSCRLMGSRSFYAIVE